MKRLILAISFLLIPSFVVAQATNPLWHEEKTKNYLPHMKPSKA